MGQTYRKIAGTDGYYRDPKSKIIHFIKSIDGDVHKFSCETENLISAKRFASKELKKRLRKENVVKMPKLVFFMDKYIKQRKSSSLSRSAIRNSVNVIERAKEYFGGFFPHEIDRDVLGGFYPWFKQTHGLQFENDHKYVRNFFTWLKDEKYKKRPVFLHFPKFCNPEKKQVAIERSEKKERVLTPKEFRKIWEVCNQRDKLLFSLMFCMGFRVESDATSAKWKQFSLDSDPPLYRFGVGDNKASLEGTQEIHDFVLTQLIEWKKITGHSRWVFPNESGTNHFRPQMLDLDTIKKTSGVGWEWTSHTFRHSCLTYLVENGYELHLIGKCFRISIKEMLETYAHLTPQGRSKMRNAVKIG